MLQLVPRLHNSDNRIGVFYVVCAMASARQRRCKHASLIEECFLFGPYSNLDRRTPVCDLHLAFKIPYVDDYVTKVCRREAEVILNHENPNVRAIVTRGTVCPSDL
jgi:hypothetical protein